MSYLFTLSGTQSTISTDFYPPIELSDNDEYSLALINFECFNSIPNVDKTNNKFYYDDQVIEIPEGSYEITDINKFLQLAMSRGQLQNKAYLRIKANNNTLQSEILCNREINFIPSDSIGRLLGFSPRKLKADVIHKSDHNVNILKVNSISIDCNITAGSYRNEKSVHILHNFFPLVSPGYKIVENPQTAIYLPINTRRINNVTVKVVDQDGELINFREEVITITLHLKRNYGN
jgi:hypothetical protein